MAGLITRRGLIVAGGAAATVVLARRYGTTIFAPKMEFSAMTSPAGFRKYDAGAVTSAFDPFYGLNASAAPGIEQAMEKAAADPCTALFGPQTPPHGIVPVASFSDYNCPYCRVLTQMLDEREAAGTVRMAWHELPLLGDTSVQAARAALAAKRQQSYALFHKRLMRAAFQATPDYITVLANGMGLDAERLAQDMASLEVSAELANSAALAGLFGIVGTPALVVGTTFVQGEIAAAQLDELIALEAERPGRCA